MRFSRWMLVLAAALLGACESRGRCTGADCGTLVVVTPAEPDILLPPSTDIITARDIADQIFLKLADIGPSTNTIGEEDFQPLLAERWEWDDPRTLVFHLDPRARWQDGQPVTAADVSFTFTAYTDSSVASPFRTALRRVASVTVRDSLTAVFRFRERYPEMFYDAVYHMRVLPAHLLRSVGKREWRSAPFGRRPVGNGPYRFVEWRAGQSIELAADSTFFLGRPGIRRLIWRFTPDIQVAVSQLIADQADVRDVLVTPENVTRVRAAPHLTLYTYRGATYGFMGFNLAANGNAAEPHPIFGERDVRRALTMAVDRASLVRSVFGDLAKVPGGPMSQLWWIWSPETRGLPFDTVQAGRLLGARGWRDSDGDGVRDQDGRRLAFRLLVPSTSATRRQYARLLQEQFRAVGVAVEIDELDPGAMGERVRSGRFDAALYAWTTDPTPSSGIVQTWTSAGIGGSNFWRYSSPAFDAHVDRAVTAATREQSRSAWNAAMATINADAPAVFLFATDNVGAVHSRVTNVAFRPDSWAALLRTWRIPQDRLIDRDRVER